MNVCKSSVRAAALAALIVSAIALPQASRADYRDYRDDRGRVSVGLGRGGVYIDLEYRSGGRSYDRYYDRDRHCDDYRYRRYDRDCDRYDRYSRYDRYDRDRDCEPRGHYRRR